MYYVIFDRIVQRYFITSNPLDIDFIFDGPFGTFAAADNFMRDTYNIVCDITPDKETNNE